MVPFYKQVLGFSMELKKVSNFKIPGLLQPWQTLRKIFSKCLTTRAELMWEGIYYSLHHPATSIPYPRFIKIIISHYMTIFPKISRRARDAYHNLQDDDIMKNIFNSGRNKNKVFGLDVPMIQSQPIESSQGNRIGTYATPRQSARLTSLAPVPTTEKADDDFTDMIQLRKIEKLVEESENVDDSLPTRHDDTSIPDTRLEPRSDKESPKVEIFQKKVKETSKDTEVEPNIVIPINVDDEEDEITDEMFELRRRAKGKNVVESRDFTTRIT
ncbi:hypothetical protein Tco_0932639 [Tanacetum coccineum]